MWHEALGADACHPAQAEARLYCPFVTTGSYCIVQGTPPCHGLAELYMASSSTAPWQLLPALLHARCAADTKLSRYSSDGPLAAARDFVQESPEGEWLVDRDRELLFTQHAMG